MGVRHDVRHWPGLVGAVDQLAGPGATSGHRVTVWVWQRLSAVPGVSSTPHGAYEPTGQGIQVERLKTIAALRNSGALTEEEYRAEERRILGGY